VTIYVPDVDLMSLALVVLAVASIAIVAAVAFRRR
jgi:hypothetical protein